LVHCLMDDLDMIRIDAKGEAAKMIASMVGRKFFAFEGLARKSVRADDAPSETE
jgi:hypothetical protein